MKTMLFTALFIFVAALSTAYAATLTTDALAQQCYALHNLGEDPSGEDSMSSVHCIAYVRGYLEALQLDTDTPVGSLKCNPTLTTSQAYKVTESLVAYVQENPKSATQPARQTLARVLTANYPCKTGE